MASLSLSPYFSRRVASLKLALVAVEYGVSELSVPDSLNVCKSPMLASDDLLFMGVNIPRRGFSKQSKGYPAILIDQYIGTGIN